MKTAPKTTGLRYWMARVLDECEHVSADFGADPVHDLRVALRRCRSMADGMIAMDPDPGWKAMKKAGRRLFQSLGRLRDVQVMMEWIEKLEPAHANAVAKRNVPALAVLSEEEASAPPSIAPATSADPEANQLLQLLKAREAEQKREARIALNDFDRKQWRQWSKTLPLRAARIRPGHAVFRHLALERWTAARELHVRALRNRSQVAFHTLRIGIKRFRYIVENFLPEEHKAWSNDLKHMQDLLGDVHDLDVLWATALSSHVFLDEASRQNWHARIVEQRTRRIEEYRRTMSGPDALWNVWRAGLPHGNKIREFATRRMKLWARVLDPDFVHSERVARLALELYDGITGVGLLRHGPALNGSSHDEGSDARASLYVAALLHDTGKAKGVKGHHKESLQLIRNHGTPLGWKSENMARAAVVARFHCGALPTRTHKALRDLLPDEQKLTIQLAAILRLANALDATHDGQVRRVKIENAAAQSAARRQRTNGFLRKPAKLAANEALIVGAEGFLPNSSTAQAVAAGRYLLETVLRRPVVIRAVKSPALQMRKVRSSKTAS